MVCCNLVLQLWELRMVKIRNDYGKQGTGMQALRRPVAAASLKACAIGASLLRAQVSLAALDTQDILCVDSD